MSKLILCIEGLGSAGYIRENLILPLQKKHPGKFEVVFAKHSDKWMTGVADLVISHSLGCDTALSLEQFYPIHVTLDPRRRNLLSFFDFLIPFQRPFTAPAGVKVFNYYRHGLLPGYPVTGAENFKVTGSHGNLPGHPSVVAKVEELLGLTNNPGTLRSDWRGLEA